MPTSRQIDTSVDAKAVKVEAYLGTILENLGVGLDPDCDCNVSLLYDAQIGALNVLSRDQDGNLVTGAFLQDEEGKPINNRVVLALGKIEQDFPAILATLPNGEVTSFVALMTAIANYYNPYK